MELFVCVFVPKILGSGIFSVVVLLSINNLLEELIFFQLDYLQCAIRSGKV